MSQDAPTLYANQSDFGSICPPDVLARCFRSQQDYTDNCAAACACQSWHETFRDRAEQIKIQQNPLNVYSLSSTCLQEFTRLHTVNLGLAADWPRSDVLLRWTRVLRWIETWQSCSSFLLLLEVSQLLSLRLESFERLQSALTLTDLAYP